MPERKPLLVSGDDRTRGRVEIVNYYVDSGEPITLRSVDCDLRCSSGILVCGMNFFG